MSRYRACAIDAAVVSDPAMMAVTALDTNTGSGGGSLSIFASSF